MSFSTLPKEILRSIVLHFSGDFSNLRNFTLVCRIFSEFAITELYKSVDFTIEERNDNISDAKTKTRQLRLLRSVAENPIAGAAVKSFKNHQSEPFGRFKDATHDPDATMVIKAARNMKHLTAAYLTSHKLSAHIIENLQDYSQLFDLKVLGLNVFDHIWTALPVALTRLEWECPTALAQNPKPLWNTVAYLVNVVERTCPQLESLEIKLSRPRYYAGELPTLGERAAGYNNAPSDGALKLTKLRHFGFRFQNQQSNIADQNYEVKYLEFVQKHYNSLESVTIRTGYDGWTSEMLRFILNVCGTLPNLKEISLEETFDRLVGSPITGYNFLRELTKNVASSGCPIERFSISNIGCPFARNIGKLFQAWPHLKFLRMGDADNQNGPYGIDGRPKFYAYAPVIESMIKELPSELTEIYLEINGERLAVDTNEDFDPVCNIGEEIFSSLRSLHTCDIHAWISNIDGGIGRYPEKAVMYRRLPLATAYPDKPSGMDENRVKALWISRMDCVYQEDYATVAVEYQSILNDPNKGVFEGKDAEHVWCDGYEYEGDYAIQRTDRGRQEIQLDYSWPFWKDVVGSYPMFRQSP